MDELQWSLTTKDNPYSIIDEFKEWYIWDVTAGYNTLEMIQRELAYCNGNSPKEEAIYKEAYDDLVWTIINNDLLSDIYGVEVYTEDAMGNATVVGRDYELRSFN